MSKSVLVALDMSHPETEKKLLAEAARLASMDGAQLDLITVVPDYGTSMVGTFFRADQHDSLVEHCREQLNSLAEEVLGAEANSKARHIVATGSVYEQILRTADKAGTELIVIGAHKPEFQDYLLGPNAARVVRHARCSVHVVRH